MNIGRLAQFPEESIDAVGEIAVVVSDQYSFAVGHVIFSFRFSLPGTE
jgi:hypothetical protein